MDQIKIILKTFHQTGKIKTTAARLQMSKNTVRHYVRLAQADGRTFPTIISLEQEAFHQLFYPQKTVQNTVSKASIFTGKVDDYIKELRRPGVTRHLLWKEYRVEHPGGYAYTQFCEHLKRATDRRDVTLLLQHKAGEKIQLDFAGKPIYWTDHQTGEQIRCEVLVAVLPFSNYTYAIALPSQKIADFIHGINQVFCYLGGLPQVVLSDNLKSYVTKANRYDPTFNETCVQLAAHFQIDLEATRVAKPKDKASVENSVTNVYRRLYAPLRNEVFFSLQELNQALERQLHLHNHLPFQKKEGTRRELFEEFEKPLLRPLPSDVFELKKTISAKVQRIYHVMLGEDKNFYSVPFQYVGRQATVVYTTRNIEIYIDNQRVATHSRMPGRQTYLYSTHPDHLPKNHQEWLKTRGYDAKYFLAMAHQIGAATGWAIQQLLTGKIHEAQSYRSCEGTLRLAKNYSNQRLEAACKRCKDTVGKVNYKMLENILKHQLDQSHHPSIANDAEFAPPTHDNIRGAEAYQ
jgi:transposase